MLGHYFNHSVEVLLPGSTSIPPGVQSAGASIGEDSCIVVDSLPVSHFIKQEFLNLVTILYCTRFSHFSFSSFFPRSFHLLYVGFHLLLSSSLLSSSSLPTSHSCLSKKKKKKKKKKKTKCKKKRREQSLIRACLQFVFLQF